MITLPSIPYIYFQQIVLRLKRHAQKREKNIHKKCNNTKLTLSFFPFAFAFNNNYTETSERREAASFSWSSAEKQAAFHLASQTVQRVRVDTKEKGVWWLILKSFLPSTSYRIYQSSTHTHNTTTTTILRKKETSNKTSNGTCIDGHMQYI